MTWPLGSRASGSSLAPGSPVAPGSPPLAGRSRHDLGVSRFLKSPCTSTRTPKCDGLPTDPSRRLMPLLPGFKRIYGHLRIAPDLPSADPGDDKA